MIITVKLAGLTLRDFRNVSECEYRWGDGVNVIWGANGAGKTNLLEAIFVLGTGESFRAKRVEEMVKFTTELAMVSGIVRQDSEETKLEVILTKGEVGGKRVAKRKYLIDEASKRKKDYLGELLVVLFRPEDMDLLVGSPEGRRSFIDRVLVQIDLNYAHSLGVYTQALRRRNRLLDSIRDGSATKFSLTFWNGLLIKHGDILASKREELVAFINNLWNRSELFNKLKLGYDKSVVSKERLERYEQEEIMAGYTLVGPHKDDYWIEDQSVRVDQEAGRNLSTYGSRGEQRMAVLAMIMGQIYYIEDRLEFKPVLLLDDIFSELDDSHKKEVLRVMEGRQVFVTTADKDDVDLFSGANLVEI